MSVTEVPIPGGRRLLQSIQKIVQRYDKCLNSGGEYVKNSSILSVSVPINLSTNLDFVSANGTRVTYFVDVLRIKYSIITPLQYLLEVFRCTN